MTTSAWWRTLARTTFAFIAAALIVVTPLPGNAQGPRSWSAADAPRFLRVSADSSQPPAVIDPSDVPLLRRRIALHLNAMTRRNALKEIARASGIQFVYADDALTASDTVRLQADDITVTAALTEVLLGAGVDVALGADGNAILVKRAAVAQQAPPAPKRDVIRGRVTAAESALPIADAEVIATMAPDRLVFHTSTDSSGRYELVITPATGDYLLYVSAPGRLSFRKRITSGTGDTVFVMDAALTKSIQTLGTVLTTAKRPRPPREDLAPYQVGNSSNELTTVAGALAPDQYGDLNALAALMPGVTMNADGSLSFGGVGGSQNRTTLNGMEFDGGALPRGMQTRTRISSSIFDPSIGGFGGGNIATSIAAGNFIKSASGFVTVDAPQLQGRDASSGRLGHQFTRLSASYSSLGELIPDLWYYNFGISATRQTSTAPSLLGADAFTLNQLSLSGDSAAAFVRALGNAGIPTRVAGIPGDVTTNSVNLAFRADRAAATQFFGLAADTRPRIGLVGSAILTTTDPTSASVFAPPSHDGHSMGGHFALQTNASRYFGDSLSYLDEFRSAVSYNVSRGNPYLDLPGGSVLATSALADGTIGISQLQFGGGSAPVMNQSWRWETTNELSFNPAKAPTHRIKLHAQTELQGYSSTGSANLLGTYGYNSLEAFAANTPSSFNRTLFAPSRAGGELSGAFAISDFWSPTPDLQLVFGPRVDWTTFTRAPAYNAEVDRAFGVRTDFSPTVVDISPRIGFTWLYPGARKAGRFGSSSALGTQNAPPAGVLRGGIGEFRSSLAPTLLSNAIASTGLPGASTKQLSCIGSAVPVPNWSGYLADQGSVPSACVGGGDAPLFTDAAPSVQTYDRSFNAPRRWTADLFWGSAHKWLHYSVDARYDLALDQTGRTDLNFTGIPKFSLVDEANRPVFVDPAGIVPATGIVSPLAARQSSAFGSVYSYQSNRRIETKQITLSLQPILPIMNISWMLGLWYTYSDGRSLDRGFDASTFGDPRTLAWASGSSPHHTIRAQVAYRFPKANLVLSAYMMLQSSLSYTPLVAQDINGDGLANDRAFVFDPAHAPTASLANGMRTLLATAPSEVRDCLSRQLGNGAGRNSCQLPWTMPSSNLRLDWLRTFGGRFENAKISLNVFNPLAGIDQLVNGSANVHGWGSMIGADPRLLYVTGFDATSHQFVYQVNSKFGTTRPNAVALYNPFRVSIDVSLALSPSGFAQNARFFTRPVRSAPGVRPPADSVLARIRNSGISPLGPPYSWITANADSLLLSNDQLRRVVEAQNRFRAWVDSNARATAEKISMLPNEADPKLVTDLVNLAQGSGPEMNRQYAIIKSILTPIQIRLLPAMWSASVAAAKP